MIQYVGLVGGRDRLGAVAGASPLGPRVSLRIAHVSDFGTVGCRVEAFTPITRAAKVGRLPHRPLAQEPPSLHGLSVGVVDPVNRPTDDRILEKLASHAQVIDGAR